MDDQLCGTNVTGHTLSHLLSKSPKLHLNGHQLVNVEAVVIGENQGFTSKILRVTLKWSDASADMPKTVVVKVIGSTAMDQMLQHMPKEKIDAFYEQLRHAHNIECKIYDLEGLKKIVPMPVCYGKIESKDGKPGIMVLEDLGDRAVVLPMTSWPEGLTPGQAGQVLESLASVHAWSVNHTEWRKEIPSLKEFNVLEPLVESLVGMFPQSKKLFPDLFKDMTLERLTERINPKTYTELFGCDPKAKYNLPLVLVHGDVHVMNMMFNKKEDGKAGDKLVALIDWQISHQGCAAEDLARILVICLSTKNRREEGDKLVRRYVEVCISKIYSRNVCTLCIPQYIQYAQLVITLALYSRVEVPWYTIYPNIQVHQVQYTLRYIEYTLSYIKYT